MELIRFVHEIVFSGLCSYSMQPLPASTVTTETIPYGKLCMSHKQLHSSQSTLAFIETRQANRYSCTQLMCKSARPGIYIESLVNRRKDKAGCRILSIHTLSLISILIQCHSVGTLTQGLTLRFQARGPKRSFNKNKWSKTRFLVIFQKILGL